jgi:hypothetical protein
VTISVEDRSGSGWAWHRDGDRWTATKVITIPRQTGSVRLGGILGRRPHPSAPQVPLGGGPRWSRSAGTAAGSM